MMGHICSDPSLELSQRNGSNDGSNICFYVEIWLHVIIPKLSLLLIWSTDLKNNFSLPMNYPCCWRADHEILMHDGGAARQHMC